MKQGWKSYQYQWALTGATVAKQDEDRQPTDQMLGAFGYYSGSLFTQTDRGNAFGYRGANLAAASYGERQQAQHNCAGLAANGIADTHFNTLDHMTEATMRRSARTTAMAVLSSPCVPPTTETRGQTVSARRPPS